jgi:hypothetical protein
VRTLPPVHKLHGELGLFATCPFQAFDVLGEYTGVIVDAAVNGHYVACLGVDAAVSLGVDAAVSGNELRFINSYLGAHSIVFQTGASLLLFVILFFYDVLLCLSMRQAWPWRPMLLSAPCTSIHCHTWSSCARRPLQSATNSWLIMV